MRRPAARLDQDAKRVELLGGSACPAVASRINDDGGERLHT
jgi:hypothetical protein